MSVSPLAAKNKQKSRKKENDLNSAPYLELTLVWELQAGVAGTLADSMGVPS